MRVSKIPCWQCGQKLHLDQAGNPIFEVVWMPLGTQAVRVHKTCKENALKALGMSTPIGLSQDGVTVVSSGRVRPKRMSDDRGSPVDE